MAPKIKFVENEKVLCFHGPLLYEAKCMKSEIGKDKVVRYYIHYNGWKKHWDEWVPESRVLRHNEASLAKQRDLYKAHLASKKTKVVKRDREKVIAGKPKPMSKSTQEKPKPTVEKSIQEKPKEKVEKTEKAKPAAPPPAPTATGVVQERVTKPSAAERPPTKTTTQERGRSSLALERARSTSDKRAASQEKTKSATPLPDKATAKSAQPERSKPKSSAVTPAAAAVATAESMRANAGTPTSDQQKRKRARLDATIEPEETFMTKVEVKIDIPEKLKPWLVDDWDLITRQKNLVSVPCKKTVDDILGDYVMYKRSSTQNLDAVKELTEGIREYFNIIFGTQLLFKFERPQYGEILSDFPNRTMSSLYGSAHLLRLFVRLGGMLVYTSLDEKTMPTLIKHIHEFLDYLSENFTTIFRREDYVIAPPEYHRKAI